MTKIAFINRHYGPVGGTERVTYALMAEQLRRGQADLLYVEGGPSPPPLPSGSKAIKLDGDRMIQTIRPLARYLTQARPDALIVASWPLTVYAVLAKYMARSPVRLILSEHNALSVQYGGSNPLAWLGLRASIAVAYRLADARVAVSRGVAEDLSRLGRMPMSRIEVIDNPVEWIAGAAATTDRGIVPAAWRDFRGARILTVGHLKPQKNHVLLVRAFARLARDREAALMIIGAGPEDQKIMQAAREEGVADRVFLAGAVANPAPYYASADLFALSSDHEGFGLVLVEAMQFGLPVVSTDCLAGPSDILADGRYGALTPVGDAAAFATAMAAQLDDPGDRDARIARAKEYLPERAASRYWRLADKR